MSFIFEHVLPRNFVLSKKCFIWV